MEETSVSALLGTLTVLILLSAYFSGSETAMMRVNRFRLKHLANEGNRGARKASRLLKQPDRLLSLILIGNNFVNFTAASIATILVINLFGEALVQAEGALQAVQRIQEVPRAPRDVPERFAG